MDSHLRNEGWFYALKKHAVETNDSVSVTMVEALNNSEKEQWIGQILE